MWKLKTSDKKIYLGIFVYCLVFFLLRVLSSNTLNCDEAEQYVNSEHFAWGYSSQAPLFTWLLIICNQVFHNATLSINFLKYLLIFAFLVIFYQSCLKLRLGDLSPTALLSLVLIPAYSYELHRDLTHTTLLVFVSMLSFYFFLQLTENPSVMSYSLWGMSIGLGLLSKYNFIILILPLLIVSLFFTKYRTKILNPKILLSSGIALIIMIPHILWLTHHNFSPIAHALHKSGFGGEGIDSYSEVSTFIFAYFPSFLVGTSVILLFFWNNFDLRRNKFLSWLSISCFTFPVLMTFVFDCNYFNYRWLVPIFFLIPLTLFANMNEVSKSSQRRFTVICLITLIVITGLRLVHNFYPDVIDRAISTNIPAQKLVKDFANKYDINGKKTLVISHNRLMLANLKNFEPKIDYIWIEEFSDDYFISDEIHLKKIRNKILNSKKNYDQTLLIWEGKKKVPEKYERLFQKEFNQVDHISTKYLHSCKFDYDIGIAKVF